MLDVGCWMLDVGCWMLDVGCWMLDVGCWMLYYVSVYGGILTINLNRSSIILIPVQVYKMEWTQKSSQEYSTHPRLGVGKYIPFTACAHSSLTFAYRSSDTYNPCPGVMENSPASRGYHNRTHLSPHYIPSRIQTFECK